MDPLQVAESLSAAIAARDLAAVERLYTDETVVWHSFTRAEQNKPATLAFLRRLFAQAAEIRYSDVRRVRTEEGYVQQHVAHMTMAAGDRLEPRPVCMVARVRDGTILRLDEYIEARRVQG